MAREKQGTDRLRDSRSVESPIGRSDDAVNHSEKRMAELGIKPKSKGVSQRCQNQAPTQIRRQ